MIQMVRLPGRWPGTPSEIPGSAISGGEPESKAEKG
jgi:hypothetical protein